MDTIEKLPDSYKIIGGGVILAVIIYVYKKYKANNTGISTASSTSAQQLAYEQQLANSLPTVNNSGTTNTGSQSAIDSVNSALTSDFGTLGTQIASQLQPLQSIPQQIQTALAGSGTATSSLGSSLGAAISNLGTTFSAGLSTLATNLAGNVSSAETALQSAITANGTAINNNFNSRDIGMFDLLGHESLADCVQGTNVSQFCTNSIGASEASVAGVNFNNPSAVKQYVSSTYSSCAKGQGYDPVCVGKIIANNLGYNGGKN